MQTSIILPTYLIDNTVHSYLENCLKHIKENTSGKYQLIIVENGSYTHNLKDECDIYIHKEEPIGAGKANNIGASLADGDYLMFINNDIFVPKDWDIKMIEHYKDGILSAVEKKEDTGRIIEDDVLWACAMIDRATFNKVGYFDESIPFNCFDHDYNIRTKKAGLHVRKNGHVLIEHVGMATRSKMRGEKGFANLQLEKQIMKDRYGVIRYQEWINEF